MTAILNASSPNAGLRAAGLLLVGASGLALAAPLAANELLFTTSKAVPETGQRTEQRTGLTQVALTGGGTVSIVDAADYRINADGSVDLYEGTVTVAAGPAGEVVVRMPEGVEGRVGGKGSAGNFSARKGGEASGHALTGAVRIGRAGAFERFAAGAMWRAEGARGVRRVVANGVQTQPGGPDAASGDAPSVVAIGGGAGPVAAALNGIPTGFGDQLAAAGASSDILAAARRIEGVAGNPVLDTFPSGDLALLVAAAAQLEGAYGGTPFPAAQADIIRAYLRFLAGGGAGSAFLASYSRFAADYLDLIRSGGLPSSFAVAGAQDVEAWLAYIRRTGAIGSLAARDRVLAEAYLAFLASGGNRDAFARSFTDLTTAYFAFVRGGGDPEAFAGANAATLAQTIAFLRDSGLAVQLTAADRALIDAYIANGGLAFAGQYRAAFADYSAFLASGRRPSEYTAVSQETLRAWLETLASTGLLATVLGERAGFYTDYLAFLRAGGTADGFARLPANIFAGYTVQLDAYFAFLATGRRPSEFTAADIATLQAWLLELQSAGALERFLGDRAAFFADYAAFVAGGGSFDAFAGLPANIFAGYAVQLDAYFTFLAGGRLPSEFTAADLATLQAWLVQLQAAGALERFLGDRAAFFADYAAFVAGGGSVDTFALLPANIFAGYASNLRAFFDFLEAGGVPSGYTLLTPEQIRAYIAALEAAGATGRFLGDVAGFWRDYAVYLAGGGNPDLFAGLPVPPDFPAFAAALNAYAAFLQGGGLPSAYTAEDLAALRSFIDTLVRAGQIEALLGANAGLLSGYFAFLAGGGSPDGFVGLPVYASYISALNAYFAFLQGGGLPSGYAALDAATIEAYLAALAQVQGGLAGIAGLDPFFAEYFTFIIGGGNPDLFAGLPVNGGGGGGPTPPVLAPQFTGALFLASLGGGADTATQATISVTEGGQITNAEVNGATFPVAGQPGGAYDQRNWEVTAAGRFGDAVAYTSYLDKNAGQDSNFVINMVAGVTTAVLPQTGVVSYRLLGGAAPTERRLAAGTEGHFTGNLGIAFGGASPRVGLDFTVASNGTTFASGTTGGAANPASGGLVIDAASRFRGLLSARAIDGPGCTRSNACVSYIEGGLFGEGAAYAGLVYFLNDASDLTAIRFISGSAVFGTAGTALPGLGTVPVVTPPRDPNLPPLLDGYSGGFDPALAPIRIAVAGAFNGNPVWFQEGGFLPGEYALDPDGGLASYRPASASDPRVRGTARTTDIAGNADIVIGRWTDGTMTVPGELLIGPNQGLHYLLTRPVADGFRLNGTGRVDYYLTGATRPTLGDGTLAPGLFEAEMAILLGAEARMALEGSITMPRSGSPYVYTFGTTGGIANPAQSQVLVGLNSSGAFFGSIPGSDNTGNCSNPEICVFNFNAIYAGDADTIGLIYEANTGLPVTNAVLGNRGTRLSGSAIFQAGPVRTVDGGGGAVTPPPYSGTVQGLRVLTTRFGIGSTSIQAYNGSTATFDANGNIATYTNTVGSTAGSGQPLADANLEAGSIGGAVAWARFLDPANAAAPGLVANTGVHTILGAPATNLPMAGTVTYTMIGGTRPTTNEGTAAPGSFSGALAVDFGARRVGIDFNVAIADRAWRIATAGGAANPSNGGLGFSSNGITFFGTPSVTGLNAASCTAGCSGDVIGTLFGAGGAHAGTAYRVIDGSFVARGLGVFAAPGAAGTPTPVVGGASTSASAAQDWSRWTAPAAGSAEPAAIAALAPATGVPAVAAVMVDPADREGAMRQAERLMGGMISFGAGPGEAR